MRLSYNWLRQWVDIPVTLNQLTEKLSVVGLEVDHVSPASGEFTNVIVGKIIDAAPHPNANKLKVCQVAVAEGTTHTIVCGAPNAREGLSVAVALVGAHLPGGINLKAAKLRGVASYGMLCSAAELGLADSSDGILALPDDAPLGIPLVDYLQLDDTIINIDLTPNRGDCLSVLGVAREVSALYKQPIQFPEFTKLTSTANTTFTVDVQTNNASCPRYLAQVIRNVDSTATTPVWLQETLRRCGLRSIHPIVDVTNYVMLALGQPLHAFDFNKLTGNINVRYASPNEILVLLDGQTLTLSTDDVVIADEQRALALAGIMGGQHSAVDNQTTAIVLESAHFQPQLIGRSARCHNLQTDSSYRFERGVDPILPEKALALATQLLQEIVGGDIESVIDVSTPAELPENPWIDITQQQITTWLGFDISTESIESILTQLGFSVDNAHQYRVQAPSHRFDVTCSADVLEEIARIYGYDQIPAQLPQAHLTAHPLPTNIVPTHRFSQLLADRGYHEVITYSFVDPELQSQLFPDAPTLELVNPIAAQLRSMRLSLWPGLLTTLQYNQRHQQTRLRSFETGACFSKTKTHQWQQQPMLAGVIIGTAYPPVWCNHTTPSDFYHLKGDVDALFALTHSPNKLRYLPTTSSVLHPGQAADIYCGDTYLGAMGALHPKLIKQLKIDGVPFLFELSLSILEKTQVTQFAGLSKFPAIRRDIALLVDKSISFAQISEKVLENAGDLLKNVELFDEYTGEGIPLGQKSVALALTLQHAQRTLVDEEVNVFIQRIIDCLATAFNASLRQ